MKATINNLILWVCVGVFCVAFTSKNGRAEEIPSKVGQDQTAASKEKPQCGDDTLPQVVKALIGVRLPPLFVGVKQAGILSFIEVNGAVIADSADENGSVIAYSEGVFKGKWTVFFVERIFHPDRSKVILDARILPADLLDWRMVNGEPAPNIGQYKFSGRCRANKEDARTILGLVRPERGKEDCAHFSSRIKQAWEMDRERNCLLPVATQGLKCEYITMNDCY